MVLAKPFLLVVPRSLAEPPTRAAALICVASALLAGVAFGVWDGLDHVVGRSFGGQVVSLGTALAVGIAFYLVSCNLLGVRELQTLLSLRRRSPSS
jgi:F0F1-type ATP synthase assembly protein I